MRKKFNNQSILDKEFISKYSEADYGVKNKILFMKKIEVEHRGIITEEKFKKLNKFLRKNGRFLGRKDRFSVLYFMSKEKKAVKRKSNPIDLKVRITNKKAELVLKYGKWSGKDIRREFLFPINSHKFDEMIELLKILGFNHGVLQATRTYLYKYNGIEFALVKVPNWGYYFEAEIVVDPGAIKKADKKIISECRRLNLEILKDSDFCKLLDDLNNRKGYRFNLKKQKFSDIKKRFINYF